MSSPKTRQPETERNGGEREPLQYRDVRPEAQSERLRQSLGSAGERGALADTAKSDSAAWYLVDDAATELQAGQARRADFLRVLESMVYRSAEDALVPIGRTSRDCPYLRAMFRFYSGRDTAEVAAAMRRYAPETVWAGSAAESAWMVSQRVSESVRVWASTGRIDRAPEWNTAAGDVAAAQIRSGLGEPLPAGVRGRMEQAFGESFAGVMVHTDVPAAEFAAEQKARALTIGQDVYFGRNQFRPGTLVGDAILAHELAHVVQQRGSSAADTEIVDRGASPEYEREADGAARTAVNSIWSKSLGATGKALGRASVAMRTGLSLQRCGTPASDSTATTGPGPITFASSNFKPSGGGGLQIADHAGATPPAPDVNPPRYFSEGDVAVSGGTDAEASDWQAGFLQTVLSSKVDFNYYDSSNKHAFFLEYRLPGATCDGNVGGVRPWYHPMSTLDFKTTNSTLHPSMNDRPTMNPPWTMTGGSGAVVHLVSSSGMDSFCSWLIVRQKSKGNPSIQYLNYDTWQIDWSATYNSTAKTGAATGSGATITGQGAGQGPNTPVLVDPVANQKPPLVIELVP